MTERQKCEEYAGSIANVCRSSDGTQFYTGRCADIIEAARRDAVEGRWVPISTLPDEANENHRRGVLVMHSDGSCCVLMLWLPTWKEVFACASNTVWWMPLPDAPAKAKVQG